MKKIPFNKINPVVLIIFMLSIIWVGQEAFAGILSNQLTSFEVMPIRMADVKGDAAKFRALNWMNDGATGGITDMSFEGDVSKDNHLSFEGHAIPGDNDLGANFTLTRKNGGYVNVDYGTFRKWYDVYGGYYSNFTGTSAIQRLQADPKVDMGHFLLELSSSSKDDPGLELDFEHNTKVGIKNTLNWGSVTQGGITRKILPGWQQLDETTDNITLKARAEVAGFKVKGQQSAELYSGRSFREDDSRLATTPALTSHTQEPQTKRLVSSIKADRWVLDDKSYMGFAYQFQHLRNDTLDKMRVYDGTGAITAGGNNRIIDAWAVHDSHSWVQHFVSNLTPDLSFVTRFKEEIMSQSGYGFAEGYNGATNLSVSSENQISRTGESISLRYNGVPKTSLYTDWDFQQSRNWAWKERVGSSIYEAEERNPEMVGAIGVRYVHNSKVNMTSQLRHKSDHDTYNTFVNTDAGMVISRLRTEINEWNNRLTWKPAKWLENSFRYQQYDNIYHVQTLDKVGFTGTSDWLKSQGTSRVYTYDIVVQPMDQWMFDLGYSLNTLKVLTPASQTAVSAGGIPVFLANVYTWLFTTSYAPKENFSVYSSVQYSRAENYDNQDFAGIVYGVDNERYDITLGTKWSPKKDLTIEPHYGYYSYRANQSVDYGNYSAHVYWLDAKLTW